MLFIEYPRCSTCKKALKFLRDNNIEVNTRNIVEEVPAKEELLKWMDMSELEPRKFFNTSGNVYKEMNLKDRAKDMSREEIAELLSTNGMLIKRPLLITDTTVLVGFKEEKYKEVI